MRNEKRHWTKPNHHGLPVVKTTVETENTYLWPPDVFMGGMRYTNTSFTVNNVWTRCTLSSSSFVMVEHSIHPKKKVEQGRGPTIFTDRSKHRKIDVAQFSSRQSSSRLDTVWSFNFFRFDLHGSEIQKWSSDAARRRECLKHGLLLCERWHTCTVYCWYWSSRFQVAIVALLTTFSH